MSEPIGSDRVLEFINSQTQQVRPSAVAVMTHLPVITISRQAGSGSHEVAEQLIARLHASAQPDEPPWAVFDRDLVKKVFEDDDLPGRLAEAMPEDRVSEISDTLDQLFGLRPSSWVLVRKTADTILHLAELGNVVIIGRAGNVITGALDHALHVRLVGSLLHRIEHVMKYEGLSRPQAEEYVRQHDLGRKRYLKKYYDVDIDDPLGYHLVINTDRMSYAEAASTIAGAVARGRMRRQAA
jgi:Cytidylate kinase-like family